jgi:predicted TIM-barrel fold metal-dependent hydrolase
LISVWFNPGQNAGINAVSDVGIQRLLQGLLVLLAVFATDLYALAPVADMHLHYKWSQQDVTSAAEAIEGLTRENVVMGVVIGTPAELALELASLEPRKIVPIFSPYRIGGDWQRWARDPEVVPRTRAALESGAYYGIGELHLIGGFTPRLDKAVVLQGLMQLAGEYDVPIMLHTEFSRPAMLLNLCQRYPDTRILWAHAGSILSSTQVEQVLGTCGNVWAGLAARDPWRFVNNPISDADGRLLPDWRELLLRYPGRFMLGSDPVWPVDQMDRWDEPDTGWQELGRFWGFHRGWLQRLPAAVALKISCENAVAFFRREEQVQCTPNAAPLPAR